jgi:hypothetical protein
MKRSEVYSWRIAPGLKSALEDEARRESISMGSLLERIAREWLEVHRVPTDDDEEQQRIRAAAMRCVGSITGVNPSRSSEVSALVRRRLQQKRER